MLGLQLTDMTLCGYSKPLDKANGCLGQVKLNSYLKSAVTPLMNGALVRALGNLAFICDSIIDFIASGRLISVPCCPHL